MIVTVVVENETRGRLNAEFGLSLLTEPASGGAFLLDTGASELVVENLIRLGVRPEDLREIVISHNHRDHIGGLRSILELNSKARVYISEFAEGEFAKVKDGEYDIFSDNQILFDMAERFTYIGDCSAIMKNVVVCRPENADPSLMGRDKYLFEVVDTVLIPDEFKHEQYVVVIEGDKMNIISACTHKGIINVLRDAKRRFPQKELNAFVGGLHTQGTYRKMINFTEDEVIRMAKMMGEEGLKALYTCHCTGEEAFEILRKHSSIPVSYLHTGDVVEI